MVWKYNEIYVVVINDGRDGRLLIKKGDDLLGREERRFVFFKVILYVYLLYINIRV